MTTSVHPTPTPCDCFFCKQAATWQERATHPVLDDEDYVEVYREHRAAQADEAFFRSRHGEIE